MLRNFGLFGLRPNFRQGKKWSCVCREEELPVFPLLLVVEHWFPFHFKRSYENGDERCGHCQLLQDQQEKLEVSPPKGRFCMISVSFCDLPTYSPAKECNTLQTVTWGRSWTFQWKSKVVCFGLAKGKHSVQSHRFAQPSVKGSLIPNFQNRKTWNHSSLALEPCLGHSAPLTEACVSPSSEACFSKPSTFL